MKDASDAREGFDIFKSPIVLALVGLLGTAFGAAFSGILERTP